MINALGAKYQFVSARIVPYYWNNVQLDYKDYSIVTKFVVEICVWPPLSLNKWSICG